MSSHDDDDAGLSATAVQSQLPAHRMRPPKGAMPDVVVLAQPSHVRRVARSLSWFFPFRVTGYVPQPGYLFLELVSEEEEAAIMEEHMPPGERRAGLSVPKEWLEAAPSWFATHFNTEDEKKTEAEEATAKKLKRLAAALYRLARDPSYATVAPMLRFFPVLGEVPAGQGQGLLHGLDPEVDRVRVQVSPRPCEREIGQTLPDEFPLTPRWEECTHMLSVVTFEGRWLWSLAKRDFYQPYFDMKILHDKHHSGEKFSGEWRPISRAYYKLNEAIYHRKLDATFTRDDVAVDVGASPGGWCQRLAEEVGLVVGIDPGDLEVPHVVYDPESGALPAQRDGTILHVRARVEDCDALLSRLRPVRICTIDMNCLHAQSLAFVRTMAPYMSIGATLILTIKLMQKASYLIPIIRGVQDDLRDIGFGKIYVAHLMSNKQQEFTVMAAKVSDAPAHDPVRYKPFEGPLKKGKRKSKDRRSPTGADSATAASSDSATAPDTGPTTARDAAPAK